MSEPFLNKVNRSRYILVGAAVGAVVVGVAVVGVAAFNFSSYKGSGGPPSGYSSPAQVAISSPPQGVQLEAGESVMVEAAAIGSNPFQSMELWVDGEMAGVQAAPSGGVHPFSTFFSWRPKEPGTHSLIAAAVDVDGGKTMSAQVVVFVTQSETGIEMALSDLNSLPAVLPALPGGGYVSPSAPGAGGSTGPAENWSGSAGDWVNSLIANEKPAAPELVAQAEVCSAQILIHDLSNNEEGFILYRQIPNAPTWLQVATLSSQSQVDWITYTDEGISGAITYYVSAFNSQGEVESNLVLVNIDPAECASVIKRTAIGTFGLTLQIPNLGAQQVYCYRSTDGITWDRWPQLGFLTPDEEGPRIGGPIMRFMQNDLAGEPVNPQLYLLMECWGWQGSELRFLGSLGPEGLGPEGLNSQENGIQIIMGEGILAEVAFEFFELPDLRDIYPIGSENDWGGDFLMNPLQMGALSAVSSEIPEFILDVTTDPNICGEHLPPDAQNFLGQLLYCFPYPEYDPNKGATMPQPYLVWHTRGGEVWGFDIQTVCFGGINEECISYPELLSLAEENGGQIGFDVISMRGGIATTWQVTEADLTMFVVPPLSCTGDTQFSVRLWYQPGNEGLGVYSSQETQIGKVIHFKTEKYYGPNSNWVTIPCKPSNESKDEEVQYLEISFGELSTRLLDDGGDDLIIVDEDVELYGYFRVNAPSMGHWFEMPCFFDWASPCDEPTWTGTRRYLLVADWEEDEDENLLQMGPAPHHYPYHELKFLELCQATSKYSCKYDGQATSYKTDNNKLRVFVKEGDALTFEMMLVDHDSLSDDDVVCIGTLMTPSKSLSEWGNINDDYYIIHGDVTDSGACNVDIRVKAVYGP